MIRALFAPLTPAEELAREREHVAKRKPHLALATAPEPPRPKLLRDPYAWVSLADLLPVEGEP